MQGKDHSGGALWNGDKDFSTVAPKYNLLEENGCREKKMGAETKDMGAESKEMGAETKYCTLGPP